MKYSISNIAWDKAHDFEMYTFLQSVGMDGIEIAPTRLFENPYENLEQAQLYATMLSNRFNLRISSMQSIWYGQSGNIFNKDPLRPRRLLMHKREIRKLHSLIKQDGYAIIPLSVSFNERSKVKLEIGVCKGKKLYDKRDAAAAKDAKREIDRTMKSRR